MKIKEAHIDFMKDIYPGKRSYFFYVDSQGYDATLKDTATDAASFGCVCFIGEKVLKQNVNDVCKEIQKLNPFTQMIIYTDGVTRPIGMGPVNNAEFFVFIEHSSSGKLHEDRINDSVLTAYAKQKSKFIFKIYEDDELEDIYLMITGLSIKKTDVYIDIRTEDFHKSCFRLSQIGFNVYVSYEGKWYEEETTTEE